MNVSFLHTVSNVHGLDVMFKADRWALVLKGINFSYDKLVVTGTRNDRTKLFYLDADPDPPTPAALMTDARVIAPMDYETRHGRLGHLGQRNMRLL